MFLIKYLLYPLGDVQIDPDQFRIKLDHVMPSKNSDYQCKTKIFKILNIRIFQIIITYYDACSWIQYLKTFMNPKIDNVTEIKEEIALHGRKT